MNYFVLLSGLLTLNQSINQSGKLSQVTPARLLQNTPVGFVNTRFYTPNALRVTYQQCKSI